MSSVNYEIDEYDEYFESVMAGASGISDAAPENIVNLEEKKKCKGKNCKEDDRLKSRRLYHRGICSIPPLQQVH